MKLILKVNGSEIDMAANGLRFDTIQTFSTGGEPRLSLFMITPVVFSPSASFSAANPLTYNGKEVEVIARSDDDIESRTIFFGDVVLVEPSQRQSGINGYMIDAVGFGDRAERIPVINPLDLTTSLVVNPDRTAFEYDSILDGKDLGEAIKILLTGHDIASRLDNAGYKGMYTDLGDSGTPATLATNLETELNDIAARPITPISFSGDNMLGAIRGVLESYDPNFDVIADPEEKRLKFFDLRRTNQREFVLGQDYLSNFFPSRDVSSSYKRVVIRGAPDIRPYVAHWNYGADTGYPKGYRTGNLIERFGYGALDSDEAKSAWNLGHFEDRVIVKGSSNGLVWPSTRPDEVLLNPASFASDPETDIGVSPLAWGEDEWTQTAVAPAWVRQGKLTIKRQYRWAGTPGTNQVGDIMWTIEDRFTVVANDPYTFGDTAPVSFTLDRPHGVSVSNVDPPSDIVSNPSDYEEEWNFELTGYSPSGAKVWREYEVTFGMQQQASGDQGVTQKIMNWFPEPQPWRSGDGLSVTLVTTPQAVVIWSDNYEPPFMEWPIGFYIDREQNRIIFTPPVVSLFGDRDKLLTGGFDNSEVPPWGPDQVIDGVPYDIKVLLPVASGVLTATYPDVDADLEDTLPGGGHVYGTASRYDGVTRTMEVGLPQWVKSADQSYMDDYAARIYDSVKDTVVRGVCEHVTLIDPFEASWHPYWLGEESEVDGETTVYRPLVPAFTVSQPLDTECDSGCMALPEEVLIVRQSEIRFAEGSGGKNAYVVMHYSNQKAPWVSPENGISGYRQMIAAELMDFQMKGRPA